MKRFPGYPLPLGVSEYETYVNFAVEAEREETCRLLLYRKGEEMPEETILFPETNVVGNVHFLALPKEKAEGREYQYEISGQIVTDPHATSVLQVGEGNARSRVLEDSYDWEGDKPLEIPYNEVIAYSLHVRGFTKHRTSKIRAKGTFAGVVEKIPYLTELGINQIQCMPVYAFCENPSYTNYWGYGDGFFFAPQNKYAVGDAVNELKDMVKACHKAGIEVVLHMPFTEHVTPQRIVECLQYYVIAYHVDGFILNPMLISVEGVRRDPVLCRTKILEWKNDFQDVMRRFLKGDAGMTEGVMWWLRQTTEESGSCNYMTNHSGFTMADMVSYERKHNEANGEENRDGTDWNYSWNCGVEGPTRKKSVLALRKRQVKNAFLMLLLSQGTPCILAGDEFGNTQGGNNNVYCQDNETAWLNWNQLSKEKELFEYVRTLIALRKEHGVLHEAKSLLGRDKTSCGVPDISFHGESAWQVPEGITNRQLGVYYHRDDEDCYIAYNMHWNTHTFALPALPKGKKWYRVLSTADDTFAPAQMAEKNQRTVEITERTIVLFVGR